MPARIINIGSLNIDHVYHVGTLVRPGETRAARAYCVFAGGKGLNQSIAAARAGAPVVHVGCVGQDGAWLRQRLADNGVDVTRVRTVDDPTGHAIIQVSATGENSIIVVAGANHVLQEADVVAALATAGPGDWVLLQNETNAVAAALGFARKHGLRVAYNPAPLLPEAATLPLDGVACLILNETEAAGLSGASDAEGAAARLAQRMPQTHVVVTCGARGALYRCGNARALHVPALRVDAVDTTGAGDCFVGYLLAALARGSTVADALREANVAAALCVTHAGAADAMPRRAEVDARVCGKARA